MPVSLSWLLRCVSNVVSRYILKSVTTPPLRGRPTKLLQVFLSAIPRAIVSAFHLSHSHSLPFPQHNISTPYCTSPLSAAIIRLPVESKKQGQHTQTSQVTEYFPIYRTDTLVPVVVSYRRPIAPILYRSGHASPTHYCRGGEYTDTLNLAMWLVSGAKLL